MTEHWAKIEESIGDYIVSNHGRVMNRQTGKLLSPRPIPSGYLRVHLPAKGKRRDFYIHRLVAEAFCKHPAGCDVINHIDNNPQNNNVDNLEWTTQRRNVYHGMKQNRYRLNAVSVIGYKDGKEYTFSSAHEAEQKTGCDHSSVTKCCKGKRKTIHGYQFRYAEVAV